MTDPLPSPTAAKTPPPPSPTNEVPASATQTRPVAGEAGVFDVLGWGAGATFGWVPLLGGASDVVKSALLLGAFAGITFPALKASLDPASSKFLGWIVGISTLEVLTLLLLLVGLGRASMKFERGGEHLKATSQLRIASMVIAAAWIVQYSAIALHDIALLRTGARASGDYIPALDLVCDIANYFTSLAFIALYVVLALPTSRESDQPTSINVLLATLGGVAGMVFSCYAYFQSSRTTGPFMPAPVSGADGVHRLAGLANGMYAGLSMALVVGRLESRYLGLRGQVVALLYVYVLIQPVYEFLPEGGVGRLMLLVSAFALKFVLLSSIGWALSQGRVAFYMQEYRHLHDHAAASFNEFVTETVRPRLVAYAGASRDPRRSDDRLTLGFCLQSFDAATWELKAVRITTIGAEFVDATGDLKFHSLEVLRADLLAGPSNRPVLSGMRMEQVRVALNLQLSSAEKEGLASAARVRISKMEATLSRTGSEDETIAQLHVLHDDCLTWSLAASPIPFSEARVGVVPGVPTRVGHGGSSRGCVVVFV